MTKKRVILVVFAVLALGGAMGGWWFSLPGPSTDWNWDMGGNVAHAAPGSEEGCVVCHKSAIAYTSCSECHDAPATSYGNNVYLKHHGDPTGCGTCHDNASYPGDARYVEVPEFGHTFCLSCHNQPRHGQ